MFCIFNSVGQKSFKKIYHCGIGSLPFLFVFSFFLLRLKPLKFLNYQLCLNILIRGMSLCMHNACMSIAVIVQYYNALMLSIELPDLANKNVGHPVKCEFLIGKVFSVNITQMLHILNNYSLFIWYSY